MIILKIRGKNKQNRDNLHISIKERLSFFYWGTFFDKTQINKGKKHDFNIFKKNHVFFLLMTYQFLYFLKTYIFMFLGKTENHHF